MMNKLRGLGIDTELYEAKGAKHAFFNKPPHFKPTLERMEGFLDKHFGGKVKATHSRAKPSDRRRDQAQGDRGS